MTTYTTPDPGKGYRLLRVGERKPGGNNRWSPVKGYWHDVGSNEGDEHTEWTQRSGIFYRVPITRKPADPLRRALRKIIKAKTIKEAREIAKGVLR